MGDKEEKWMSLCEEIKSIRGEETKILGRKWIDEEYVLGKELRVMKKWKRGTKMRKTRKEKSLEKGNVRENDKKDGVCYLITNTNS